MNKGEQKHKFIIGDIISDNKGVYRVNDIVKNCIGQDCYFLVNVERENKGLRYLKSTDSNGKTHNFGERTCLCEQVDAKFEKQGEPNPYSGVSFKYNGHTWGMCARDNGVEILVDGQIKERVFLDNKPQGKSADDAVKEEKVDNQKMINKIIKEVADLVTTNTIFCTKEVLTSDEAARYLGMSKSYLYKLTMKQEIPHFKPLGKMCYFNRQELEAWLQSNRVGENRQ